VLHRRGPAQCVGAEQTRLLLDKARQLVAARPAASILVTTRPVSS
jgi:hypothetical protein